MSKVQKLLFILSSILFLHPAVFTQVNREWVNRYNGNSSRVDIASSLKIDASSNVYVCGMSSSLNTLSDILILKYNSSGALLWESLFDGYGNSVDQANSFFLDNAGNSYITGFSADTNQEIKIVTLKYNSSGTLQWKAICRPPGYTQSMGYGVTADVNGNVYTTGSLTKLNGTYDFIVLKYGQGGALLDSSVYDEGHLVSESALSICVDNSSNVYIMGSVERPGVPAEILVVKFNSSLNAVWSKELTGSASLADSPVQMIMSGDNKLIVCGALNNISTGLDYGVFRLDTNSTVLMQYSFNGSGNNRDIPYAVTEDASSNIYVTGSSRNADTLGSEDIVTLKINQSGVLQWSEVYNGIGAGIDYGTAITTDISGNTYVGGATDKGGNHVEYALIKYSSFGDMQWIERYSKIMNSEDFVYSVAVDSSRNVFVTGISFDSLTDYDIATIKYSQPIGITQISAEVPSEFMLYPNYPNPFNPVTKIKFTVPQVTGIRAVNVRLSVYDISGKEVDILADSEIKPGIYETDFDARDLPSGVYFYRLSSGSFSVANKMILLK